MAKSVTAVAGLSVKCPFLLIVMQFESLSRRLSRSLQQLADHKDNYELRFMI